MGLTIHLDVLVYRNFNKQVTRHVTSDLVLSVDIKGKTFGVVQDITGSYKNWTIC